MPGAGCENMGSIQVRTSGVSGSGMPNVTGRPALLDEIVVVHARVLHPQRVKDLFLEQIIE
jgi:hypothetical protein